MAFHKVLENIKETSNDKNRIMPYSDKNKKTKNKLLTSTLNPLTSSLSPSSKSKGVRLVSIRITKSINPSQMVFLKKAQVLLLRLKELFSSSKKKNTRIKVTSYDILWRILRDPPNLEKLLITLQPNRVIENALAAKKEKKISELLKFWIPGPPNHGRIPPHNKRKKKK